MNFAENDEISDIFVKLIDFIWIFQFWGVQAAQTLILSKEYKGFVKGRGIQKFSKFHELP